eukprot:3268652-Prymnesium_polylepis.2
MREYARCGVMSEFAPTSSSIAALSEYQGCDRISSTTAKVLAPRRHVRRSTRVSRSVSAVAESESGTNSTPSVSSAITHRMTGTLGRFTTPEAVVAGRRIVGALDAGRHPRVRRWKVERPRCIPPRRRLGSHQLLRGEAIKAGPEHGQRRRRCTSCRRREVCAACPADQPLLVFHIPTTNVRSGLVDPCPATEGDGALKERLGAGCRGGEQRENTCPSRRLAHDGHPGWISAKG